MAERTRAPKFSEKEKKTLIDAVEKDYSLINGKFTDQVTLKKKGIAWMDVTRKVNAHGKFLRTVEQVKKKWEDLKGDAKKAANKVATNRKKTGNLPRDADDEVDLTEEQRRIVGLLGVEQTHGIAEGIDTDNLDADDLPYPDFDHQRGSTVSLPNN